MLNRGALLCDGGWRSGLTQSSNKFGGHPSWTKIKFVLRRFVNNLSSEFNLNFIPVTTSGHL